MIAPCKDCERKGCGDYHDKCEKYIEFRKRIEIRNTNMKKESESHDAVVSSSINRAKASKRGKRRP